MNKILKQRPIHNCIHSSS